MMKIKFTNQAAKAYLARRDPPKVFGDNADERERLIQCDATEGGGLYLVSPIRSPDCVMGREPQRDGSGASVALGRYQPRLPR